jgi:DNA-binding CsgD family transcriptional regulator
MNAEMPLVGRQGLLDRMVTRLGDSECAAFVVTGAAGVGKSRLASEVAGVASRMGRPTAHVVATRGAASIPFGAFAPLITEPQAPTTGLLGLLRQTSGAILERAVGKGPLLLVVDDAHLLDDGSAALVHLLVHESSCAVIASVRTPGPAPDPITTLWKDGLADRLDLDPLSEIQVEELARGALGGPLTGAGVRWLWETSAGNPLYVRELLAGAAQADALHDHNGMWRVHLPLPIPVRLSELVAARMADLSVETAEVVDLLAIGEPLDLSLLSALAAGSAVEDAEQRGLITVRENDVASQVGLSHPLYGEIRRQQMPRLRLRRLAGTLAEAVQSASPGRHDDDLRVARWQLDAGVAADAVLLTRAAQTSRQMYDLDLAARLGRAALTAGGGVDAGLALAEAEFFSGRHAEAEAVLADLLPQCADDEELSRCVSARAYNLGTLMGDHTAAVAVLESALSTIVEPSARYRLLYRQAADSVYSGEARIALAATGQLLESGDDTVVERGARVASVALALLGQGDDAVAMSRRGVEAHARADTSAVTGAAHLIGSVLGHAACGRLAEADKDALAGYQGTLEAGDQDGIATYCLLRGWVLVDRGMMADAARMFREGVTINEQLGEVATHRWCLGGVALAEAMAGNAKEAASSMAALDGLPSHWMDGLDPDLVDRGRAWAQAAVGEMSAARATLRQSALRAAAIEQPVTEARMLHDLARLGEPATFERLATLAEYTDSKFVRAFADHAASLSRPSGRAFEKVAVCFEDFGALGLAAEAGWSAASTYRGEGLPRPAVSIARKAEDWRDRCGGSMAPGVAPGPEALRLTRREREVATLAVAGLSSRDIAERLYLSVRTVENHLQRVYAKLGVTNREDLGATLT